MIEIRRWRLVSFTLLVLIVCQPLPDGRIASAAFTDTALVPPANDNFASSQLVTGTSGSTSSSNIEATGETGEPNHAATSLPLNSVWYRWVAPSNLSMTFGTAGGGFNTTMAVYTGTAVNALTLVAEDDNIPFGTVSSVTFIASAGVTYHIAVDGFGSETGNLSLGLVWSINRAESSQEINFDGDFKSDFAVFRNSNNTWFILNSGTGTFTTMNWGFSSDFLSPGRYEGIGRANIAVWRPATGTFYKAAGLFAGNVFQAWGTSGDLPIHGDFDGDDRDDFAIWRGSAGAAFYVLRSSTGTLLALNWGTGSTDIPAPGDYDGDGRTDFAVFRYSGPDAGTFYVRRSSNGSVLSQRWGLGEDLVVAGDYDGDGKSDFAVRRSSNNTFYILRSSDGTFTATLWGIAGDRVTPGDYDGDGKTDIAVWRPSTGAFYVLKSIDGLLLSQLWGQSGDRPVAESNTH